MRLYFIKEMPLQTANTASLYSLCIIYEYILSLLNVNMHNINRKMGLDKIDAGVQNAPIYKRH